MSTSATDEGDIPDAALAGLHRWRAAHPGDARGMDVLLLLRAKRVAENRPSDCESRLGDFFGEALDLMYRAACAARSLSGRDDVFAYEVGLPLVGGRDALDAALARGLDRYAAYLAANPDTVAEAFLIRSGTMNVREVVDALAFGADDTMGYGPMGYSVRRRRARALGLWRHRILGALEALLGFVCLDFLRQDHERDAEHLRVRRLIDRASPPPARELLLTLTEVVLTAAPPYRSGLAAAS